MHGPSVLLTRERGKLTHFFRLRGRARGPLPPGAEGPPGGLAGRVPNGPGASPISRCKFGEEFWCRTLSHRATEGEIHGEVYHG